MKRLWTLTYRDIDCQRLISVLCSYLADEFVVLRSTEREPRALHAVSVVHQSAVDGVKSAQSIVPQRDCERVDVIVGKPRSYEGHLEKQESVH